MPQEISQQILTLFLKNWLKVWSVYESARRVFMQINLEFRN